MAYLFDQNDPAAKDAFKKALAEAPAHVDAKINLAGLYTHYGYRENARILYQTLTSVSLEDKSQALIHPRAREFYYENNKLAKN